MMEASAPTFCPDCGTRLDTRVVESRTRPWCSNCRRPVYRNPKPCAGVVVVDGSSVLLVERTRPPAVGSWSLPAGFLEVDEPPGRAAVRELREETAVTADPEDLTLFDTTFVGHPDGDHVLVLIYVVERGATSGHPEPGSDAGAARFWRLDTLLEAGESLEPGYRRVFERAIASAGGTPGLRRD